MFSSRVGRVEMKIEKVKRVKRSVMVRTMRCVLKFDTWVTKKKRG